MLLRLNVLQQSFVFCSDERKLCVLQIQRGVDTFCAEATLQKVHIPNIDR